MMVEVDLDSVSAIEQCLFLPQILGLEISRPQLWTWINFQRAWAHMISMTDQIIEVVF